MERRRYFTPMVFSSDVIPVSEALSAQNRFAGILKFKMKGGYSELCGFLRERISLAIVRSNSLLLHIPQGT